MADRPQVAVLMGSDSDLPVLEGTVEVLEQLEVPFELRVMSAHRSPQTVMDYARQAAAGGLRVIIAAAGGAAHLAGVVAAHTTLPVIGVPIPTDRMGGMDSLFSTLQMPAGVPVATMGLGRSGARNAAVMACEIIALTDDGLRARLLAQKTRMGNRVSEQDARVQSWLKERRDA